MRIYKHAVIAVCIHTYIHTYIHTQGIVITARVHPGESQSSHVMRGIIDFLTSSHPQAVSNAYIHTYTHINTYMHICMHIRCVYNAWNHLIFLQVSHPQAVSTLMYVCICVWIYACMYVCVCVCVYVHPPTHTCTRTRTHTPKHTHTHIHACTNRVSVVTCSYSIYDHPPYMYYIKIFFVQS